MFRCYATGEPRARLLSLSLCRGTDSVAVDYNTQSAPRDGGVGVAVNYNTQSAPRAGAPRTPAAELLVDSACSSGGASERKGTARRRVFTTLAHVSSC